MQMEALKETELTPESPFDENPYYGVGRVGHSVSEEEFFRKASKRREGKLDAGRTVRSGYAYDFDSTDQVRSLISSAPRRRRQSSARARLRGSATAPCTAW